MKRKSFFNWIFVLIYAGVIFYLSSLEYIGGFEFLYPYDPYSITLHILEFLPLGFLLFNASTKKYSSFVMGSLYGVSDEFHQFFFRVVLLVGWMWLRMEWVF